MFMHAGWVHVGGNMLFLWVFGRRIEDACGPWRYLTFYLFCGISADLLMAQGPEPSGPAPGAT